MDDVRIVFQGGEGQIEEKKSRFIATVRPCHTEQEALDIIAAVKKKYWDARHNCYAYVIGDQGLLDRYSDDGEPQGTAGRPILDVLKGEHIIDAVVVVTRYFGGTLLGTGGLVRAYSGAARAGLSASKVMARRRGFVLTVGMAYTDLGKIQHFLGENGIPILDTQYTDRVQMKILAEQDVLDHVKNQLTELTGARVTISDQREVLFAQAGEEAVLLGE